MEFLSKHLGGIGEKEGASILSMLEAERMRMFMFTSCGWFFNDISGVETKQVISFAVRAAELAGKVTEKDYLKDLLTDLRKAGSNDKKYANAGIMAERDIISKILRAATDERAGKRSAAKTNGDGLIPDAEDAQFGGENMTDMNYGGNLAQSILSTLERDPAFRNVAYFSMEIGLTRDPDLFRRTGDTGRRHP